MGQQKSRLLHKMKIKSPTQSVNQAIDTATYRNVTPLWYAVRYGDKELASILLQCGALVDLACGDLNSTPLLIAAHNHDVDMVRLLLEAGASPNVMDKWNYTPLMYAAIHNEPDVVELLFQLFITGKSDVNFGAVLNGSQVKNACNCNIIDINAHFEDSYITYVREPLGVISGTALHLAVQNPHLPSEVVEKLLKAGSDVNARNLYGQIPVVGAMLDIYYDYHSNIQGHTELLLKYGADTNIADIRGWTPFHYAAQRGSISCIELLLRAGTECNISSPKGETPFWILLAKGWRDTAKYLLQNGCDLNQPIDSMTLLALNDRIELCCCGQILPIEFAICNKFFDVAELMVKCGCKISDSTWIGKAEVPFDSHHARLLQLIGESRAQKNHIKSLASCCKNVVRNYLKQGIVVKLDGINLPQSLKNYLCFK